MGLQGFARGVLNEKVIFTIGDGFVGTEHLGR